MPRRTLADWLDWQQGLHPQAIDLGLERLRQVARRLGVAQLPCPVITVAGTNGKGSCVALAEGIYRAAGYRVASYTSPHLLRYNERIRLDGAPVEDAALVAAFERIEAARGETSLTYFEFGTLAALLCFAQAAPDLVILEVGLGGRLDAVNLVDADVALIASIGLDHTDWLGPDRESIGREKAGIARAGRPLVCADPEPPASIAAVAAETGARLYQLGRDFAAHGPSADWSWSQGELGYQHLPAPGLAGAFQQRNAAAVLAAVTLLGERLPVSERALRRGLAEARLAGRFQRLAGEVEWVLDVAHNPDSARALAATLAAEPAAGRTRAVLAMMARKDAAPVLQALAGAVDEWYLLELPEADARPAAELAALLPAVAGQGPAPGLFETVARAARPGERVLVFGSFRTVEEALRWHAAADDSARGKGRGTAA